MTDNSACVFVCPATVPQEVPGEGITMKLFVTFGEQDDHARFVVLCDGGETVSTLRRLIAADFRAVFPARPPLCFFRMATADGFFLTDAARVSEVLDDNGAVMCHRADAEAAGVPLPEQPSRAEVESAMTSFRDQIAYIAHAAIHAALRTGESASAEAMSVVLAVLLLEGHQRPETRLDALAALRRGLLTGSTSALPTFIATGGLFVLLRVLSPSTRMDSDPQVLETAMLLLERLAVDRGDALLPVLLDCDPANLLQKLALDSRCSESVRSRAATVWRLLERPKSRPAGGGQRAQSAERGAERSERLRAAGAMVAEGGNVGNGGNMPHQARGGLAGGRAPAVPSALNLRMLLEHGGDVELQRQTIAQLDVGIQSLEEIREAACNPRIVLALFQALRMVGRGAGGGSGGGEQRPVAGGPGEKQLALFGRVLSRIAGDPVGRMSFGRCLAEFLLPPSSPSDGGGTAVAGTGGSVPHDAMATLRDAWPVAPADLRKATVELLGEALRDRVATKSSPLQRATLLAALMEASMPEELPLVGLRILHEVVDLTGSQACGTHAEERDGISSLVPRVVNAALLRSIPREPLLCLNVLGALAFRDHFRSFFCTQTSLLQFLAHCCKQPGTAAASAVGPSGATDVDPATLQRSAARCLANLSSHPAAREWVRRSSAVRSAFASADDYAVSSYLGVALGADARTP